MSDYIFPIDSYVRALANEHGLPWAECEKLGDKLRQAIKDAHDAGVSIQLAGDSGTTFKPAKRIIFRNI